jgi:histidinol-phosphate/aromatic aminotransferase/cobyric acid decarboxylase-like protein
MPLLSLRNVLLLRSMTKDHGLAGVRLGYVIGRPAAVLLLKQRQVTWSVSAVAQAAGVAALNRPEHVARGRQAIAEGKHYLSDRLTTMGLAPCPSGANFLLLSLAGRCPTRESEQPAAWLRRQLLQRGILVRDCASFGLPQHVRISVRRLEDCVKLMDGIAEVVS